MNKEVIDYPSFSLITDRIRLYSVLYITMTNIPALPNLVSDRISKINKESWIKIFPRNRRHLRTSSCAINEQIFWHQNQRTNKIQLFIAVSVLETMFKIFSRRREKLLRAVHVQWENSETSFHSLDILQEVMNLTKRYEKMCIQEQVSQAYKVTCSWASLFKTNWTNNNLS